MLKEAIIGALKKAFGDEVRIDKYSDIFAKFDGKHPSVGDLTLGLDSEELIVSIGDITHGHFGSYLAAATDADPEEAVAESVVGFLNDLFDDKYLLFKSEGSGGWARDDMIEDSDMRSPNVRWFKWSGPIDTTD